MVTILMMSAKLGTPDLLKIKIFRNKGYDVIIPDYSATNKNVLPDSNYIVDVDFYETSYHNLDFVRI